MRRVSKPPTGIAATFVVHKSYTVMNDNEQKELSYHRVQQMIQDQIDRIEHETDTQSSKEEPREQRRAKCGIIAKIKRCFRIRCLRFHK